MVAYAKIVQPSFTKYVEAIRLILFNQVVVATITIAAFHYPMKLTAITSIYCHPIEHALSNLAPVLLGPTLCGAHVTTLWIWACVAVMSTTFSHSGYHFPFQPSPEAHDYHHKV
ncbi:fatty acid hydroxylase family protein [Ancylostoma duodenale]|uniref:Fatty acid hydroxylase family protein n=1 Tax=Ancylostoma duodenale TaxID=51022 RepID=A0A0C2H4E9_9BILA|nr:fatty acid hydroxylase family protein [Ancylostoma duodenale]